MLAASLLIAFVNLAAIFSSDETFESVAESAFFGPVQLTLLALTTVGVWRTFIKAGLPGWSCIVPIYNLTMFLRAARLNPLWCVLFFCPLLNVGLAVVATIRLAHQFGRGAGFGFGLVLLPFVFYPWLAFGAARYQNHTAHATTPSHSTPRQRSKAA